MISNDTLINFELDWREANEEYLRRKAEGVVGFELQYYRDIALLRAQIRSVAFLYNLTEN